MSYYVYVMFYCILFYRSYDVCNIGRLGGWSGVWVYILFCCLFWMPRAPFGVPCQCLGPALGLAGARKGKVTPSGGVRAVFDGIHSILEPKWTQNRMNRMKRMKRMKRKRWQRLQLRAPLPHAPGVRMTVVNKLPQIILLSFALHWLCFAFAFNNNIKPSNT